MNIYRVGVYIEDEFTPFAICTTVEYANKAKKMLEDGGWEDIEIVESDYELDTIVLDDKVIDLTV